MTKHWMMFLSVITLLSLTVNTLPVNCSIALIESPPFMELAEQADLMLIGKVIAVQVHEKDTVTFFQVSEYIKEKNTSPDFTLRLAGGTKRMVSPVSPTFDIDEEYLLFLMDDKMINLMNDLNNDEKSYYLLFNHYGKPLMRDVDMDSLNTVREFYGSNVLGDDPKWVYKVFTGSLISVLLLFILFIRRQIFS